MPRFGFYGDDFTGSVDALLQFRRAGVEGVLVTDPGATLPDPLPEVVGFAGVARSRRTADLDAEVRPPLERLRELGADIVQYKACSTADSSPEVGSLGRVIEIARELFGPATVPVAFAQPDFGRYTVFGHHFAREGEEVHRLDRQPTMRDHPVTPATESDLRLHLAAQTALPIAGLPWTAYGDASAVARGLDQDAAVVVADALTDAHLDALAAAVLADRAAGAAARFVLGSGGISGALGRAAAGAGRVPPPPTTAAPADGPVLVLSGSASSRTRDQVAASGWPVVDAFAGDAVDRALDGLRAGEHVVVSSMAGSRAASSAEVEERLAAAGDAALRAGVVGRLLVCGGDTSGNVLRRLGIARLEILAQPWGNAPLLLGRGDAPHLAGVELVLKGGQVGHPTLLADVASGTPLADA